MVIEENERLRKALEYYADPQVYRTYGPVGLQAHPILAEGGVLARLTLGIGFRRTYLVDGEVEAWTVLPLEAEDARNAA